MFVNCVSSLLYFYCLGSRIWAYFGGRFLDNFFWKFFFVSDNMLVLDGSLNFFDSYDKKNRICTLNWGNGYIVLGMLMNVIVG